MAQIDLRYFGQDSGILSNQNAVLSVVTGTKLCVLRYHALGVSMSSVLSKAS